MNSNDDVTRVIEELESLAADERGRESFGIGGHTSAAYANAADIVREHLVDESDN